MTSDEFKNRWDRCDMGVISGNVCLCAKRTGRRAVCLSGRARVRGLACPYYWDGDLVPISMNDVKRLTANTSGSTP
jgi:hypothetical protein